MGDILLQIAGGLAVVVSVIHGVLGETKIFAKAKIEPAWIKLMLRLLWQSGTLAWIGLGVLLIVTPYLGSSAARHWIVAVAVANFALAALANGVATRWRHFGWMAMTAVSGLALAGL